MQEQINTSQMTVHKLANSIRRGALKNYGEKTFAKMAMQFTADLPSGEEDARVDQVMRVLVEGKELVKMQLALCWLDSYGYGDISVKKLAQAVRRVRTCRE